MKHELDDDGRSAEQEARRQAEADKAALERLYGSKKQGAKGQWGIGIALLVLGPVLIAVGAGMGGEVGMIAVGVIALAVGIWAFFDGVVRSRQATLEERKAGEADPR